MVGAIFNLAKVNIVPCMCAAALTFGQRVGRLNSLAYTESITDAYSQYFVNDIEHTEDNKQGQNYKLSLVPITWTSYCQLLHGLPLVI